LRADRAGTTAALRRHPWMDGVRRGGLQGAAGARRGGGAMSLFQGVRRVLRLGAWRRELDDELAFHFDETVAELESAGLSPAQAKEEARRRFGDERRWRRELQA